MIHEKISRQAEIEFHLIQDICKKKKKKRLLHRASSQLVNNMFLSFSLLSHHSPTFKRVWTVKDGLKPLTLTLTQQTINLEPGLIRIRIGRNGERKITFDFMKSHNHKANVKDYFYVGEDLAKDQRMIQKKVKKDWRKMRLVFTLVWFSTSIGCFGGINKAPNLLNYVSLIPT